MQTESNVDANNARITYLYHGFLNAMWLHPIVVAIAYFSLQNHLASSSWSFANISNSELSGLLGYVGYGIAFLSIFLLTHLLLFVRFNTKNSHMNLASWENYCAIMTGMFGIAYGALFAYIAIESPSSIVSMSLGVCCLFAALGYVLSASKIVLSAFVLPVTISLCSGAIYAMAFDALAISIFTLAFCSITIVFSQRYCSVILESLIAQELNNDLQSTLNTLEAKLNGLVTTDKDTGLFTRAYFDQSFALEFRRAKRAASNLSIIIAEIDCFDDYEEEYGAEQGAKTYRAVAAILKSITKRAGESVCIYNKRAFVFLLPTVAKEDAEKFAKIIQKTTLSLNIPNKHSVIEGLNLISVSVGISEFQTDAVLSRDDLIKYAESSFKPADETGAIDLSKPKHWFTFGKKEPVVESMLDE